MKCLQVQPKYKYDLWILVVQFVIISKKLSNTFSIL